MLLLPLAHDGIAGIFTLVLEGRVSEGKLTLVPEGRVNDEILLLLPLAHDGAEKEPAVFNLPEINELPLLPLILDSPLKLLAGIVELLPPPLAQEGTSIAYTQVVYAINTVQQSIIIPRPVSFFIGASSVLLYD